MPKFSLSILSFPAALILVGCGGSKTEDQKPQVAAPTNLHFRHEGENLEFTWTQPQSDFDSYEFEGRMGQDPFEQILKSPKETNVIQCPVNLLLECNDFAFRLRAMLGNIPSPYTNEVKYHNGLIKPSIYTVKIGHYIHVSWVNNSKVAEDLRLERGPHTNVGLPTQWELLPAVFGDTSYYDTNVKEGEDYYYRVTYRKGDDFNQDFKSSKGY